LPFDYEGRRAPVFYASGTPDQTLILTGTGTGLSPLYGILRDALRLGHTSPIHLFHGARDVSGLYLTLELREIAAQHAHVFYTACLLEGEPGPGVAIGALDQIIKARVPKLAGCRAWLCGDPELVRVLKKKLFPGGMALNQINADLFLPAAS
jgi:NAD(P)H-flavin reductase